MSKFIRTLQPVSIYSEHSLNAQKIRETDVDEYIPYNRVKLRNKIRWYEIILENGKFGYIQKDKTKIFKCSYVSLEDDEAYGFGYKLKVDEALDFYDIFFPKKELVNIDDSIDDSVVKSVELKQVKDLEKNKAKYNLLLQQ